MAGPWEAFQDAAAATLTRNDASIVAPPRAPVASSARVIGDAEGQRLGLYDSPAGPWDAFKQRAPQTPPQQAIPPSQDRAPLRITVNPIAARFGEMEQPERGATALQEGLNQRGMELTRGPQLSPAAQMAGEMANLVPAASQGTTPHVSSYGGKLISTEVFEDDGGNILYRDPETKEVKPTNNTTHVALRDPADGVVKVFERSEQTNEGPVTGVARVLAPGLGAGAPTARPAIAAANKVIPRASDTFASSKPFYRAFKNDAGKIEIPPETGFGMADQIRRALGGANLIPELAQPVYSALGILEKGEPMTLDILQNLKRVVGRGFNSPDKNVRDAASVASAEVGKIISQVSREAGQNLKTADAIHSTARAQQELQRKGEIAGLRTGRAGYGGNAVNNYRQVLSPIVQRAIEGKTTSFKPNEIAAMRDIVEGSTATNALRMVGQLSPSKGSIPTLGGIPLLGTTWAIGAGANKLATILTEGQINKLADLVAKRSPAYRQAIEKAVDRFEKSQIEFANKPTPNTFAAYLSASRGLSAGLTRDGIPVTSGDLIKSLTGPIKTAADEDQAPVQGPSGQ